MIKISFILLAMTISLTVSATEIIKIHDGAAAYCPPVDVELPGSKSFSLKQVGDDFVLSLQICQKGQFVLDPNPTLQSYSYMGHQVKIKTTNFRIQFVDSKSSRLRYFEVAAPSLESTAQVRIPVSQVRALSRDVAVTIRTTMETSSSNGFRDQGDTSSGSFRILFKNR